LTAANRSSQLPDVRAVKFDIERLDRDRTAPGYWFVSPYLHIEPDGPTTVYEPSQIGPHIYDEDGVRVAAKVASTSSTWLTSLSFE